MIDVQFELRASLWMIIMKTFYQ